jgi:hypothetical protein
MKLTIISLVFASLWCSTYGEDQLPTLHHGSNVVTVRVEVAKTAASYGDNINLYEQQLQTFGDWVFCSLSSQCINGCCSNLHFDDGQLKCTPVGGFQADHCVAYQESIQTLPAESSPPALRLSQPSNRL